METPNKNLLRGNWLKLSFGLATGSLGTACPFMKSVLLALLLACCSFRVEAQVREIDSLRHILTRPLPDTSRTLVLARLCEISTDSNIDSAVAYGQQALTLAQRIRFPYGEIIASYQLGRAIRMQGDNPKALALLMNALEKAEQLQAISEVAYCLFNIAAVYLDMKDYAKGIAYDRKASAIFQSIGNRRQDLAILLNIALCYRLNNQLDSALIVMRSVFPQMMATGTAADNGFLFHEWGRLQFELGNHQTALAYVKKPIPIYLKTGNLRRLSPIYTTLASFYDRLNQPDSAIYYAQKGLAAATTLGFKRNILGASQLLAKLYEPKDPARALYYLKIATATNNDLYGATKVQSLQKIVLEEQERQRQAEAYQNRLKQYALIGGLVMFLLVALILYRNNRQKQQANHVLAKTLTELRNTQTQLIQREKMASLGELTAGIAHEIQNPLNFVNNFSEVSVELIEELKDEAQAGRTGDVLALADDLVQNLQRITQNGQRASNIVKGMLEHSRTSTGERQPTNLNALCDEYQRLAYQGQCAKNKAFECVLETHFDPDLPPISVVAGDMSRVLLNLFNNAFYAVGQKQKTAPADYKPTVSVSTTRDNGSVEIRVRDNGTGIPEAIREKIFQPFFTTKPTGEGTGLGLSLSYDIVTKGHGGTLAVKSVEGEGAEFIIDLPVKTAES